MIVLILGSIIRIYLLLLWARFIIEWVRVINPNFTPRGILLVLAELVYTLTDPPIKKVHKFVQPLRIGQLSLDLALPVVMFGCWLLLQALYMFAGVLP